MTSLKLVAAATTDPNPNSNHDLRGNLILTTFAQTKRRLVLAGNERTCHV